MELSTGTQQLKCCVKEGVAKVTLNNPKKSNALSDELTPALRETLVQLEQNDKVRCLIITGAGESFCSGGDVSSMEGMGGTSHDKVEVLRMRQRTLTLRLYNLKKPTIAALPGPAAGAGLALALACDFRYAVKDTFVTTGYGRIALSGDYGGTWLLANLTNISVAKEMYFSCRKVDSEECHKLGIFNDVFEKDVLETRVVKIAKSLAQMAPVALANMKHNLNSVPKLTLSESLDLEAENLYQCVATEDHKNAIRAFLEKRMPEFKGY